jgi:hypothetical protein
MDKPSNEGLAATQRTELPSSNEGADLDPMRSIEACFARRFYFVSVWRLRVLALRLWVPPTTEPRLDAGCLYSNFL